MQYNKNNYFIQGGAMKKFFKFVSVIVLFILSLSVMKRIVRLIGKAKEKHMAKLA
jgi:hypothetical protein